MAKRRNRNKRSNRNTLTKASGAKRTSAPNLSPAKTPTSTDEAPKGTSTPAEAEAKLVTKLPQAAQVVAFTELEEAFFAAGDSEPHLEQVAAAEDDIEVERRRQRRPSLWKRLFARAA